jgi:hypothetical protein
MLYSFSQRSSSAQPADESIADAVLSRNKGALFQTTLLFQKAYGEQEERGQRFAAFFLLPFKLQIHKLPNY